MPIRIVAGIFLGLLLYGLVSSLSPAGFFVMTATGIAMAQFEFYGFYFKNRMAPLPFIGVLFGLFVIMSFYLGDVFSEKELIANMIIGLLVFITFYGGPVERNLYDVSITLFGVFYISWLLSHLILIRGLLNGKSLLFFLFLVTYSSDTGAYFVGRTFGKRKLCYEISPNKTWAGAFGGLFSSVAMAVMANRFLGNYFALDDVITLGVLLGVMGPLGDLAESVLKRSAGVKDSGALIPGHGGLLDRVDSLIFTAPIFYYYILLFIINRNEGLIAI